MNSAYSSPYSVKPNSSPIQFSLNTDNQQDKYGEEETFQKAPPELPFGLTHITDMLGSTFTTLAELHRQLNNAKNNPSVNPADVEELQGKIDQINNLILELPKSIAKLSL